MYRHGLFAFVIGSLNGLSMPLHSFIEMTMELGNNPRMREFYHEEPDYDKPVLFVQFPPDLEIVGAENTTYSRESEFGFVVFIHKNNRYHYGRMTWFEYTEIDYANSSTFQAVFRNYNHVDSTNPLPILRTKVRASFEGDELKSVKARPRLSH